MQGATAPDTLMRSVADAKAKWGGSGGTGKATVLSDIRKRVRFVRWRVAAVWPSHGPAAGHLLSSTAVLSWAMDKAVGELHGCFTPSRPCTLFHRPFRGCVAVAAGHGHRGLLPINGRRRPGSPPPTDTAAGPTAQQVIEHADLFRAMTPGPRPTCSGWPRLARHLQRPPPPPAVAWQVWRPRRASARSRSCSLASPPSARPTSNALCARQRPRRQRQPWRGEPFPAVDVHCGAPAQGPSRRPTTSWMPPVSRGSPLTCAPASSPPSCK